jgi:hypothetical protein
MYPSMEWRNAEIAEGATLPAADLRRLLHASAEDLAGALDALPTEAWAHEVVTAQGRTIAACDIWHVDGIARLLRNALFTDRTQPTTRTSTGSTAPDRGA